jgi:hypothetical protein
MTTREQQIQTALDNVAVSLSRNLGKALAAIASQSLVWETTHQGYWDSGDYRIKKHGARGGFSVTKTMPNMPVWQYKVIGNGYPSLAEAKAAAQADADDMEVTA